MSTTDTEVVIIGGSSAGLSAALTLARAHHRAVVIDSGGPRHAPAEGAYGLLGLEGINPLALPLESTRRSRLLRRDHHRARAARSSLQA